MRKLYSVIKIKDNQIDDITTFLDEVTAKRYFKLVRNNLLKKFGYSKQNDPTDSFNITFTNKRNKKITLVLQEILVCNGVLTT